MNKLFNYRDMWSKGINLNGRFYSSSELQEIKDAMAINNGMEIYSYVLGDHDKLSDLHYFSNEKDDRRIPDLEVLPVTAIKDIIESYEYMVSSADCEREAVYLVAKDYLDGKYNQVIESGTFVKLEEPEL